MMNIAYNINSVNQQHKVSEGQTVKAEYHVKFVENHLHLAVQWKHLHSLYVRHHLSGMTIHIALWQVL
jgi:hypothetical protein